MANQQGIEVERAGIISKVTEARQNPCTTVRWAPSAAILLCFLTAACKPSSSPQTSQDAPGLTAQSPRSVAILPLQRGYYVASDTPCAQASNATLLLLRRNGIGGARYFCEFRRIEQTGPTSYVVEEACADFQEDDAKTQYLQYEVVNNDRFLTKDRGVTVLDARYCAQSELPPDWRNTDISSETE